MPVMKDHMMTIMWSYFIDHTQKKTWYFSDTDRFCWTVFVSTFQNLLECSTAKTLC